MSNIEGIAQKIIKQMQEQGRVKTLSKEQTYSIDNELAEGLKPIKEEFYKKHHASRYYINELERTTVQI